MKNGLSIDTRGLFESGSGLFKTIIETIEHMVPHGEALIKYVNTNNIIDSAKKLIREDQHPSSIYALSDISLKAIQKYFFKD